MEERILPHNEEAEQVVLGSILINPHCIGDVNALLAPGAFYIERNNIIYQAMLRLEAAIDEITLAHELNRMGKLEAIGGAAYLSHLVAVTPTSIHAVHYAKIVSGLASYRQLITAGSRIASIGYECKEDAFAQAKELLAKVEPEQKQKVVEPKEHADLMVNMIASRRDKKFNSVPFGYQDLDKFLGGMYGGDFVIVGARPRVGKSQLLLEIAVHNAKRGHCVLFASAEMSLAQLMEREIVMATGIDIHRLRSGELSDDEWEETHAVVGEAADIPLYFLCGKLTVANLAHTAQILKDKKGLRLVLVDYVQLLKDRSNKSAGDTLRERIGYISSGLKSLAMDLDIPVISASQFSRAVESREHHIPALSDLKESGDLEQDADVVLLLHRPELYEAGKSKGILEIGIAKTRQLGKQGVVKLIWVERQHRYGDYAKSKL